MALLMGKYATVGNQTAVNGIKTSSLETAVDSMSINQRVHRLVPWAFVEVQHRVSFTIKDCSYFLVPTSPYVIFGQISDIILRFQVGYHTQVSSWSQDEIRSQVFVGLWRSHHIASSPTTSFASSLSETKHVRPHLYQFPPPSITNASIHFLNAEHIPFRNHNIFQSTNYSFRKVTG